MNPPSLHVLINGERVQVPHGISVAAAIARTSHLFRRSVMGDRRAPLCGMGVCFECRVTIDGVAHQRACQRSVLDGMRVDTDG